MGDFHHDDHQQSAPAPQGRNAALAKAAAEARLVAAQKVGEAVTSFHDAADRIDAAKAELAKAREERLAALRTLRECGLSMPEIADLTSLSVSRIQTLTKTGD